MSSQGTPSRWKPGKEAFSAEQKLERRFHKLKIKAKRDKDSICPLRRAETKKAHMERNNQLEGNKNDFFFLLTIKCIVRAEFWYQ